MSSSGDECLSSDENESDFFNPFLSGFGIGLLTIALLSWVQMNLARAFASNRCFIAVNFRRKRLRRPGRRPNRKRRRVEKKKKLKAAKKMAKKKKRITKKTVAKAPTVQKH